MFKERLKEVGLFIVVATILFSFITLVAWLTTFVPDATLHFIAGIIMFGIALVFISAIIYNICKFIDWLFIEPYKHWKKIRR
jgi:apolipoprotein N-acyltransferase